MMKRISIEKADDGTFILKCAKPEKKGEGMGMSEEDTYTAADMDEMMEIVEDKMGGDDNEGTEDEKMKKAWDKETKKKKGD